MTFRVIANDFREKMGSSLHFSQKGNGLKIAKGAFGPTYAGQDNPDQGATGDAQHNSTEVEAPRCRKELQGKRTRLPDKEDSSTGRSCVACGQFHHVFKCF